MTKENEIDSYLAQYGSGLCYSLGLFLSYEGEFRYCRAEVEMMAAEGALQFTSKEKYDARHVRDIIERLSAIRWFSRSINPIRNLVIPKSLPPALIERLHALRDKCVAWSHPSTTGEGPNAVDVRWALDEVREMLRLVDEARGITTTVEDATIRARRDPALVFGS